MSLQPVGNSLAQIGGDPIRSHDVLVRFTCIIVAFDDPRFVPQVLVLLRMIPTQSIVILHSVSIW
jgi:hypothetical protein